MTEYRYITANELMKLTNNAFGLTKARLIIKEVNKDIENSGCLVPCNYRAPKNMVLEKLGLKGD